MSSKLPIILCFHGYGSSGAIFRAQTTQIRAVLASDYQFLFIDAPFQAPPGPGILPCFADCGPYYSWFSNKAQSCNSILADRQHGAEFALVSQYIAKRVAARGVSTYDVAGVMGFSQGALVASLLSLFKQRRDPQWANLRLAVLLCGAYHDGFAAVLRGSKLHIPSIHVHGLKDPILESSRMLHMDLYNPNTAIVIEHDVGHRLSHGRSDVEQLVQHIRCKSRVRKDSGVGW